MNQSSLLFNYSFPSTILQLATRIVWINKFYDGNCSHRNSHSTQRTNISPPTWNVSNFSLLQIQLAKSRRIVCNLSKWGTIGSVSSLSPASAGRVLDAHQGLYQYTLLLFGIALAPAIFQRLMETILQGIPVAYATLTTFWKKNTSEV